MKTIVIVGWGKHKKNVEFKCIKDAKQFIKEYHIDFKCFIQEYREGKITRIYAEK